MTPRSSDLWFLPLGGCGEIGMNFNLYGHDGHWLIVDCGVTFERPSLLDPNNTGETRIEAADPKFIADRKDDIAGLIITHAHEDHIGAVPYLWDRLRCPVYATPFTAEILRRKLGDVGLVGAVPVHIIPVGGRHSVGPFDIEWLNLTHSIPEPSGILIRTPAGNVFHTADWKIDHQPVLGEPFDAEPFRRLADADITAMVCDSTNATLPGWSASEGDLYAGIQHYVKTAPGRVIVACFASNLARLLTLLRVARDTERSVVLLGRSLHNMLGAARSVGLWDDDSVLVRSRDMGYLPRDKTLVIATGSQGESRAALSRLAANTHPDMALDAGDRVIFSSKVIPGNESDIQRLVKRLQILNVEVIASETAEHPIHASGHPAQDELSVMYEWVKPQLAIPVHGEEKHMQANAAVAKASGVPRQLTGQNGDLFMLAPQRGVRRQVVKPGRVVIERQ
ncbi:ribonuclease J [Salinispirillum marinum]|uniref:Ribonuclease J n=2 Tax=Saccharospirillaceae TaxID=255527 RepID=A0ABV8BE56_9GAMM